MYHTSRTFETEQEARTFIAGWRLGRTGSPPTIKLRLHSRDPHKVLIEMERWRFQAYLKIMRANGLL